jgi:hypothetical protein
MKIMVLTKGSPQLQIGVFNSSQGLNLLYYFEFEYRKHRTIKGDAN